MEELGQKNESLRDTRLATYRKQVVDRRTELSRTVQNAIEKRDALLGLIDVAKEQKRLKDEDKKSKELEAAEKARYETEAARIEAIIQQTPEERKSNLEITANQ